MSQSSRLLPTNSLLSLLLHLLPVFLARSAEAADDNEVERLRATNNIDSMAKHEGYSFDGSSSYNHGGPGGRIGDGHSRGPTNDESERNNGGIDRGNEGDSDRDRSNDTNHFLMNAFSAHDGWESPAQLTLLTLAGAAMPYFQMYEMFSVPTHSTTDGRTTIEHTMEIINDVIEILNDADSDNNCYMADDGSQQDHDPWENSAGCQGKSFPGNLQ